MNLNHRYLQELEDLERNQIFCGNRLDEESNILIIGTFNPDDQSCSKFNDATWFYGRQQSNFWEYLPTYVVGENLKCQDNLWRSFCRENKIVIVDLIKTISDCPILKDFSDSALEHRLAENLTNVTTFDFGQAFNEINFRKVIYTRKTWGLNPTPPIPLLTKIRDDADNTLLNKGIVKSPNAIIDCYAPWQTGKHVITDWQTALSEFNSR